MNHAKAKNNVVSFSSFAERSARSTGTGTGRLRVKIRSALNQGQKEAFLAELTGYVDEVLGNRAVMIQEELAGNLSGTQDGPARCFRLLQGGKQ